MVRIIGRRRRYVVLLTLVAGLLYSLVSSKSFQSAIERLAPAHESVVEVLNWGNGYRKFANLVKRGHYESPPPYLERSVDISSAELQNIPPDYRFIPVQASLKTVHYVGRWYNAGTHLEGSFPGVYIELRFSGTFLGLRLRSNDPITLYYMYDPPMRVDPDEANEKYKKVVIQSSGIIKQDVPFNEEHELRIILADGNTSIDNATFPIEGFFLQESGDLLHYNKGKYLVEFAGDSSLFNYDEKDQKGSIRSFPFLLGDYAGVDHTTIAADSACLISNVS